MGSELTPARPTTLQWVALGLLVLSVAINYADRGNLAVAANSLQSDLKLNTKQIGDLTAAFFWTYALFQLVAGKLIDHWNVNWVFAVGFFVWSGATGLTGAVSSFAVIFMLRILLGAGESIAYPSYSKIIATSFPESLRGTANGLIDVGSKVGPALGVFVGVEMLKLFSWRGMFIAIGCASLLWLLPWSIVAAKIPAKRIEKASTWAPTYSVVIRRRQFWGTAIGLFGGNYAWYFLLSWLPYYFERERHYHKDQLALVASLPFFSIAISALIAGPLADLFIRHGYDAGRVRQIFLCVGLLGCCAFLLPAVAIKDELLANALMSLAAFAMGAWSSNHWALTQRLSGPAAAGKWTAAQNCLGNFSGGVGGVVTGSVLAATHSFFAAFAIACAIMIVAVVGYWFVIGRPDEVQWGLVQHPVDRAVVY